MRRLRLELLSCLVEIDLLLPKSQRLSIPERDHLHAKSGAIEGNRGVDVGYGENEVVEMIDNEFHTLYGWTEPNESSTIGPDFYEKLPVRARHSAPSMGSTTLSGA